MAGAGLMNLFDIVFWDGNYMVVLLTKIAIAVALFAILRYFSGLIASVNPTRQLIEKDNPAFGISMSGVAVAVTIMITGTVYGTPEMTIWQTISSTGLYGLLGIALMSLSRLIFDDIALPNISLRIHILKGNVAVGIIDAGNVIATAIIIRSVMLWVEFNTPDGIKAVLVGYLISQILMTVMTMIRVRLFAWQHPGRKLQSEFENGNIALALRFTGHRVGTALAISAAASTLLYELSNFWLLLLGWVAISLVLIGVLNLLALISDKIILMRVDVEDEVVRQRNIALGAVQGATFFALGLLLAELLA